MISSKAIVCAAVLTGLVAAQASAQMRSYPLESTTNLRLHNVSAEQATLDGRRGVQISPRVPDDIDSQAEPELLAVIIDVTFSNGTIEAEVAGKPAPGAFQGARGFVGIAFRLQEDMKTYDAFYLRPTNGRAEDQARRNRATQYISHPDWTWSRLRSESPGQYEAYVDLVPDTWTRLRIEVKGAQARLYVHGQQQPTLIVNDLKSGPDSPGGIALWIGPGTLAHFRDLSVSPSP